MELVTEYLETYGSRVWAALARDDMHVWLGCFVAVLNLD